MEQSWEDGKFGKAIRFDGTSGFVSTQATGAKLGIDGKKSRTISFWTFVEDGNPRSQPGFYGYGERSCPGENRYWGLRNIKDGGYTQLLSQHWCWDPRAYHNNDLRIVGHIFLIHLMVLKFQFLWMETLWLVGLGVK